MSLEQNTKYINVYTLLKIEPNEENKSLKESIENIFKNQMYQKDIETICGCLLNQRTYIEKLKDSITEASRQLNERIAECNKLKTNYTIQTQKLVKKTIAFIILSITIGLIITLLTCL